MVLAALPDSRQKQRVNSIMQSQEKMNVPGDVGSGLLVVAKELSLSHSAQQYSADYHSHRPRLDRYIDAIKEVQKIRSISTWMSENKPLWEWIDRFLQSESSDNQDRGEYLARRDRSNNHNNVSNALCEQGNSDSDLNGDINDSDESDDYGASESRSGVVIVKGAGVDEVNGIYTSSKKFDSVPKFTKTCLSNGQQLEFTLFRCVLSDGTRRWYISVIPRAQKPGTNKDIDYYFCPANDHVNDVPHGGTWQTAKGKGKGLDPPPTVEWKDQVSTGSDEHDDDNLTDEGNIVEYDGMFDDNNNDDSLRFREDDSQP